MGLAFALFLLLLPLVAAVIDAGRSGSRDAPPSRDAIAERWRGVDVGPLTPRHLRRRLGRYAATAKLERGADTPTGCAQAAHKHGPR